MKLDKNFIVTELDFEDIEIELAERLEIFIEEKLGKLASKQTEVIVEYHR
jgi:hypothetical protein